MGRAEEPERKSMHHDRSEHRKLRSADRREIGISARSCIAALALIGAAAACGPSPDNFPDEGHFDILLASTEEGGGALAADFDFSEDISVFESANLGGLTLYASTEPGFMLLDEDEPDESVFVLEDGVEVSLEVVSLDSGARFKFGEVTLDEVGDSVVLGTTPELHEHPEWQVVVPEGVTEGDFSFAFKLTTDSSVYQESETITATLSLSQEEPPVEE
jgi:hypothetical protein